MKLKPGAFGFMAEAPHGGVDVGVRKPSPSGGKTCECFAFVWF